MNLLIGAKRSQKVQTYSRNVMRVVDIILNLFSNTTVVDHRRIYVKDSGQKDKDKPRTSL